ncbi:MAG: hypothetical protein EOP39_04240 [Rubrivivax sp.]|nr:MAG: hypothetical protein EOP39_04240 [Rubrivivax sp.]
MTAARVERIAALQAELVEAKKQREYFSRVASEQQDQSYEPGTAGERMACRASAATYSETAGKFAARILEIHREIAKLAAGPSLVTAAQVAAVDDTMKAALA